MKRTWISGPPLAGFYGFFDSDYGDPDTAKPYATIVPTWVGNSLLPFRCPRCKEPMQELACPMSRECYHDARAGKASPHYWCPRCGCRFRLDLERRLPLPCALPPGAVVGPSLVERGGEGAWQDRGDTLSTVLGWLLPRAGADYAVLV